MGNISPYSPKKKISKKLPATSATGFFWTCGSRKPQKRIGRQRSTKNIKKGNKKLLSGENNDVGL